MLDLTFSNPPEPSDQTEALRAEVRSFLRDELKHRTPGEKAESWNGFDAEFSRRVGSRGWLGMTWPKKYGGHECSALERYVVVEEMLAAGAPVAAHWIADRQSGPSLLRYGTEEQRQTILPAIARGECFFGIGMSEPDSGSDLAAARTRAVETDGGFVVNGTKLWTTNAHRSHYLILFCKTDGDVEDRHGGTSQFIVDLSLPGIEVNPILSISGEHHFNEVNFTDTFLPESALLGKRGDGWKQVTGELSFERSGPDRFLSSFAAVTEMLRAIGTNPSERQAIALGRLAAHIIVLRRMSLSIAGMLQNREDPSLQAAMVKDLGSVFEQETLEIVRQVLDVEPDAKGPEQLAIVLDYLILNAPSFSIRGGTREILRGIIARGLGLR